MELTDAEVEALGSRGYFVRDGFLGEARALEVRAAALARVEAATLKPAGIRRGADHALETSVRGDHIEWVLPGAAPELEALWLRFQSLGEAVSSGAYLGLGRFDLQLACYPGGGAHYARHRDAFPGQFNRRLTAIWYANADWMPEHGGVLRLFPEDTGAPVEVAPVLDRLVVFLSERLEHEVMPAHATRLALTAWFYGRGT
ncbi:2OG-Fe(II) oxygenase [Corallococcus exiguus]|nr:2OG-Fe(II) oxygenase [Corallococcus exiguus]NRD55827.1 2OG-Fe(II) oxygenase [Corallococcus exiguus]RKH22583.1 2OG-Fe(II) oxygenase [Corallococcus sp. CA041A]RKI07912.1 2OG-Fe(II) oxygenase [Corallococcus sp. AB030]RUO89685.1 2OG-Fe(II) oxygenase [Corallococcus sp. AB018]